MIVRYNPLRQSSMIRPSNALTNFKNICRFDKDAKILSAYNPLILSINSCPYQLNPYRLIHPCRHYHRSPTRKDRIYGIPYRSFESVLLKLHRVEARLSLETRHLSLLFLVATCFQTNRTHKSVESLFISEHSDLCGLRTYLYYGRVGCGNYHHESNAFILAKRINLVR